MFERGSRSKQVATFMLPADAAAFGAVLAERIAGFAAWETHRRDFGVVVHESLGAALEHDHVQAFLRLLGASGPTIQYLSTRPADVMDPGRLAYKWFPEEEGEGVRRDFAVLADLAWMSLLSVTKPHVVTADGKPARRYRIGAAAKDFVLARPDRGLRDGGLALRVLS